MMLERSVPLLGEDGINRLRNANVLVVGVGGVGCAAVEALARAGVGGITLMDGDVYSETNLNRQLFATRDTLGRSKAAVAVERVSSINPACSVKYIDGFYKEDTVLPLGEFTYIADCIDDVGAKVLLISRAAAEKIKIISCMGAGNKLDPMAFRVTDISKTEMCPLAKAVRQRLRKMGIVKGVKAVWSNEPPFKSGLGVPASVSFVPPAAGLCLAGEIIKDIACLD